VSEVDHAGPSTTEKLVYMANQISRFFASQPGDKAALSTADHIKSFWTPHMLRDIYAHLDKTGGEGLGEVALEAVKMVREKSQTAMVDALHAAGLPAAEDPGNDAG
jgi:formate dehydrogenase subunit delta